MVAACKRTDYKNRKKSPGHSSFLTGKYVRVPGDEYGSLFNANVTDIFRNEYLTPRSPYTTLQLPVQGIGEWCHPKINC